MKSDDVEVALKMMINKTKLVKSDYYLNFLKSKF